MKKINLFELSITALIYRFYLMMAVVIALVALQFYTLATVLGFTIAVSCILGIGFENTSAKTVRSINVAREVELLNEAA